MKKLLALFLALIMAFGLVACDEGGNGGGPETIVGKWTGEMDISAALASSGFTGSLPKLKVILETNADGSLAFYADPTGLESMTEAMIDASIEIAAQQFGGMEALEAMLAMSGMTMAQLREQAAESISASALAGEFSEEGFYKYEDGKLHIAGEKEDLDAGKPDSIWHVTLSGSTLTVKDIEQDGEFASADAAMAGVFPFVLKK